MSASNRIDKQHTRQKGRGNGSITFCRDGNILLKLYYAMPFFNISIPKSQLQINQSDQEIICLDIREKMCGVVMSTSSEILRMILVLERLNVCSGLDQLLTFTFLCCNSYSRPGERLGNLEILDQNFFFSPLAITLIIPGRE